MDGCLATPSNANSKLSRRELGCHACCAVSVGTFGSQTSQSNAYSYGSDTPRFLVQSQQPPAKEKWSHFLWAETSQDSIGKSGKGSQKSMPDSRHSNMSLRCWSRMPSGQPDEPAADGNDKTAWRTLLGVLGSFSNRKNRIRIHIWQIVQPSRGGWMLLLQLRQGFPGGLGWTIIGTNNPNGGPEVTILELSRNSLCQKG